MHERRITLAVLTFARAAMGFQFQSVAAVSPHLLEHFQMSYAALGTLVGLYLLPGIAVALLGGVLALRFGDKRIVCIGLAAMTFGGALMGATDSFGALVAGRVVSGAGAVLLNVLVTKMVSDWFQGREIATALGILITSWPLGIAIALVVLPAFTNTFSWPAAMYATAAVSAAALVLVALSYRAPPSSQASEPGRFQFGLTGRELALATLAGLVWTFYNVGFIVVLAFGPEFLIATGRTTAAASAIVSTASWVIIPALPVGAWLAERVGRPDVTMIACFVAATLAIWLAASQGSSLALFAMIGLVFGPPGGLIMTLPGEAVRLERRAIAMGIYFTCYYVGMGVAPALAGYARDLTGNAAAPLWFAGAMLILASLTLFQFRYVQSRVPHAA
jgi:MFS family permease